MASVHIILQGKGGVGKSMIAAMIAQYLLYNNQTPLCIDTDPINATFEGYKALNARLIGIMKNDEIDTRMFDTIIEQINENENNGDIIIDNGASSFVALSHYLISNQISQLFQELGHDMVIHTVITGGQSLPDTINGFVHIVKQFPAECLFMVWLNPYWGPIVYNGKNFEQMKAYTDNVSRLSGIIKIPDMKKETYGHDFSEMLQNRKTFDEVINDATAPIMTRQRIKIIRRQLFNNIDEGWIM